MLDESIGRLLCRSGRSRRPAVVQSVRKGRREVSREIIRNIDDAGREGRPAFVGRFGVQPPHAHPAEQLIARIDRVEVRASRGRLAIGRRGHE